MRYKYKNENLKEQVRKKKIALYVIYGIILFGTFLCSLSYIGAYKDIYSDRTVHFSNTFGQFDSMVYTVEINEMPEEIHNRYYVVRTGGEALVVCNIREALKKFEKTGHTKVRGVLHAFSKSQEDIRQKAFDHLSDNHYFGSDTVVRFQVSKYYLDCSDVSFTHCLSNDHPVGLSFGGTFILIGFLFAYWERSINIFKYLIPRCGKEKYSPQEIDEQADLPGSVWLKGYDMYITPKMLIGTNKGITAVGYEEIDKVSIQAKKHSEAIPGSKRGTRGYYRYRDYYIYRVIVRTKNRRRLIMCDSRTLCSGTQLKDAIIEKCGEDAWVGNADQKDKN